MRFAAFIMTYERAGIIGNTIARLFEQSQPPEKVLVIDNSGSDHTRRKLEELNNERVEYFSVGYNSGPAGAAKIGLRRLAEEGYDWVYWGDDNDPPVNKDTFRNLLAMASGLENAGAIGSLGGFFNRYTARTRNLMNRELKGACEVDFIPGGKNLIINAQMPRWDILPSEELFFGFEELDYCLKIKKAGFKIYVDGDAWLRSRIKAGHGEPGYKWQGRSFGKEITVRHYYSARNMLLILSRHRLYAALLYTFGKTLAKSFLSFRFGFGHGLKAFRVYNMALLHFLLSKKGRYSIKL